jgi:hypothetical protein
MSSKRAHGAQPATGGQPQRISPIHVSPTDIAETP